MSKPSPSKAVAFIALAALAAAPTTAFTTCPSQQLSSSSAAPTTTHLNLFGNLEITNPFEGNGKLNVNDIDIDQCYEEERQIRIKGRQTQKIAEQWVGPAAARLAAFKSRIDASRRASAAGYGSPEGTFTPKQYEALLDARASLPSGRNDDKYWSDVARRVPGQDAEACKAMSTKILNEKAVGTKANFFKGYVEVEGQYIDKGYVDEDADVMGKIGNIFGGRR